MAAEDLARAHEHHHGADDAQRAVAESVISEVGGERVQTLSATADADGENLLLALFGVVTLHHADAAERFGEASYDFGGDFRTGAKNRGEWF